MNKNVKNVFNKIKIGFINFIILLLILIVILVIYIFIQLNFLNKEYVNIFGYSIFQIETGSMAKTLEIDDIIIVKLGNDVKENEIITYKKNNEIITHRLIRFENDSVIAKGDNNSAEDEPIKRDDIIGKVIFTFHDIRVWKSVFTDIKVLIPIIITFILLILLISYKEKIGEKNV